MKARWKYPVATVAALALLLLCWHFFARPTRAGADEEEAAPTVAVVRAERGNLEKTITLTADFRAYQEIDLHAKVAGFVRSIPVDIGDRVKQGGVIATLEIPELQEDLKKAQAGVDAANAAVNESKANYQAVHLDFTRLQQVSRSNPKLVAGQELDDARSKDQAAAASLANTEQRVGEAEAEQKRQVALVDYSRIVAPFDGVVTKRYADVGAMIQAGTSSEGSPVVRFAQENVVRTLFPVPESAAGAIRAGAPVSIRITGMNRTIQGVVTRFARQFDASTRTMQTEADLPNEDLAITPGMFGWATLVLEARKNVLSIPLEGLSVGETPTVYVVGKDRTSKSGR